MNRIETKRGYVQLLKEAKRQHGEKGVFMMMRQLAKNDLFFLFTEILNRKDGDRDWLFDRCREVQKNPNGHLDLWARGHYKSSIITFALTIQDILNNPELCICIFAFTGDLAKAFLIQIKQEFENNDLLKDLFYDILYEKPKTQSPRWSINDGIVVKRKNNPKESTIESSGLVDGMPIGKHYDIMIYDDIVTDASVSTSDQMKKTDEKWVLSGFLGKGADNTRERYIGTRYHKNDTYKKIIESGTAIPRIYPATDNGKSDGKPVFLSENDLEKSKKKGLFTFACQMLQDPTADNAKGFQEEWLQYWQVGRWDNLNRYILVDPAGSEKNKNNDYTVMWVIGVGQDKNFYIIDCIRDRLNLPERNRALVRLHKRYTPLLVGYEKYGMQGDWDYTLEKQEETNYRFDIVALGGGQNKQERIEKWLLPLFEQKRIYIPKLISYVDYQKKVHDLIHEFRQDEYLPYDVGIHDDMLDCMARIKDPDLNIIYPKSKLKNAYQDAYKPNSKLQFEKRMA